MQFIVHACRQFVLNLFTPNDADISTKSNRFLLQLMRFSMRRRMENVYEEPRACAVLAGLRYSSDSEPGIQRITKKGSVSYLSPDGTKVSGRQTLKRIAALVIPPTWRDVWICVDPYGHLQVTGRDARGRKQYRYHTKWNELRNITKFDRLPAFGKLLPRLRRRIRKDLALPGVPKQKILAAIVQLLEKTLIRIGNEEYAKENQSYGLTTLQNKHVTVRGSVLQFHFKGKSGVVHTIDVSDSRLADIVRRCMEIPGDRLFEYIDDTGRQQSISSDDVNAYLKDILGDEFTAKDYRTWRGTVIAAKKLKDISEKPTKKKVTMIMNEAVREVAKKLGNTPAVCRKYYIHPLVFQAFNNGTLIDAFSKAKSVSSHFRRDEVATLKLLAK